MSLRIIAKRWNNSTDQVITHVKIESQGIFKMENVWNGLNAGKYTCHTLESGIHAKVYALTKDNGTKYLTTSPDGTTRNNLDELPNC